MTDISQMDLRDIGVARYTVEADPKYLQFKSVDVTKVDESKPWKPAAEVSVVMADGSVEEHVDAKTPFFTFKDQFGKRMTVSAEAAGHIDALHIKGVNPTTKEIDPGSKFEQTSLSQLFKDAADKMPEGIVGAPGVSAFDLEMGVNMGKEGIASTNELVQMGILGEGDIKTVEKFKDAVSQLNKTGSAEEKAAFIEKFKNEFADCKIQFQLVRGDVLVPVVDAPKQPTTKLFMVFGPGEGGDKTLYTAAPGRNMPRHPNPNQHKDQSGAINDQTFAESSEAWFSTVMLTGKE